MFNQKFTKNEVIVFQMNGESMIARVCEADAFNVTLDHVCILVPVQGADGNIVVTLRPHMLAMLGVVSQDPKAKIDVNINAFGLVFKEDMIDENLVASFKEMATGLAVPPASGLVDASGRKVAQKAPSKMQRDDAFIPTGRDLPGLSGRNEAPEDTDEDE